MTFSMACCVQAHATPATATKDAEPELYGVFLKLKEWALPSAPPYYTLASWIVQGLVFVGVSYVAQV